MLSTQDTIVAISSPPGRSPRGLVRWSGPRTGDLIAAMTGAPAPAPRTLAARRILLDDSSPPGDAALPCLLCRYAAPHSYTGQDLAEVQVPGNPALLDRLVLRAVALGARPAEPGEFTFRAFLAGKLDLTQAEGVAAAIAAVSDSQLQAANLLRAGELGRFAAGLVDDLATQLALVEAGIDFVDQDDVTPIGPAALDAHLAALGRRLDDLLTHSRPWGALEALPRAVLVGPPNAGKSTLFNALLGRTRAVTSPVPGTTRDILAEPLTLTAADGRDIEIMLVDMAGLGEARTALDGQMQAAARAAVAQADVVLRVIEATDASSEKGDKYIFGNESTPPHAPVLWIRTKADLAGGRRVPLAGGTASGVGPISAEFAGDPPLSVSAVTGQGRVSLRTAIARAIGQRGVSVAGQMLALQPRHESALRAASAHLAQARRLLLDQRKGDKYVFDDGGDPHAQPSPNPSPVGRGVIQRAQPLRDPELIAQALRQALNELECLGGRISPDDLIGKVFATFCVGK